MRYVTLLMMLGIVPARLADEPPIGPPSSRHSTRLSRVCRVYLEPTTAPASAAASQGALRATANTMAVTGPSSVDLGQWSYRVERAGPEEGVPWRLFATPLSELKDRLKARESYDPPRLILDVPITKVPEGVWNQWFDPKMQDVVGIHFHQFLPEDAGNLLVTVHKVPPDGPDGRPPKDYRGKRGTRLEATLLKPLSYHLDQTFVVRLPRGGEKADLADHRLEHERGHGALSLNTLIRTLAGPQNWNVDRCSGRRSTLAWYWSQQKLARRWDGYRGGNGELLTLRTTITLVPPTRWSMLIGAPPEEVPQSIIQAFNDNIIHLHEAYGEIDHAAQEAFHQSHGAFEEGP